jgi:predicted phosphodiesterase
MDEEKKSFWNNFLFNFERRRLTYSLLALFFVTAGTAVVFICKNADRLASYNFETDLLLDHKDDSSTVIQGTEGTQATDSSNPSTSTGKKSTTSSSTSSSGGGTATGETPTSGSGSSGSGESLSSFVAFYTDNQSDTDEEDARHASVVEKILATGGNPIFHAGDLMEDGTADSLNRFNNVAGGLLASRSFYGALGNNDRNGGDTTTPSPLYLVNFSFPNNERWYSVNSGNLHLIVLDSAFGSSDPAQTAWLQNDLASSAATSRMVGVIFHHPTFYSTISSYLLNSGVDFVVSGHIHTYSHSDYSGLDLFTLPGGSSLGYATASVYSSYLTFRAYDTNGGLIEQTTVNNR